MSVTLVDEVRATDEEVVINEYGVPAAVLVSPDELNSLRETVTIRLNKEFMGEIRASLAALDAGRGSLYTLTKLFQE